MLTYLKVIMLILQFYVVFCVTKNRITELTWLLTKITFWHESNRYILC